MAEDKEITEALKYKKIAVIGISPDPSRASYGVSGYMKRAGYAITGVRPGGADPEILGRPCYERLSDVPGPLEIVNVFRRSDAVPQVIDEVITELKRRPKDEGPKVVWLQEGVTHAAAEAKARSCGLIVISDLCILKEHARLIR